jgi:GNAT superfamily N-acetyltransferase
MMIEDNPMEFRPLVLTDWNNLEQLFGKRGASSGCWCMWWRQTQTEFDRLHGEPNRLALKSLVESGTVPGVLAYKDNEPAGWCAIEPRESYPRLERSKILARVDNQPVWSVTCFYIGRQYRRKGLMRGLLNAAINWAAKNGANIIEAYPFVTQGGTRVSAAYMGVVPVFLDAGFIEVMRRSQRRPIMRKLIK